MIKCVLGLLCLLAIKSQGLDLPLTGTYDVKQQVSMEDGGTETVGYKVISSLIVSPKGKNLYTMKLQNPSLHIMSRKAPSPKGFIFHSSPLDNSVNKEFVVEIQDGMITEVHLANDESVSMRNIKKGILSGLQFNEHLTDGRETDSSGDCFVEYKKTPEAITKVKKDCKPLPGNFSSSIWGATLNTVNSAKITLVDNKISSVVWTEEMIMESHLADFAVVQAVGTITIEKKSDSGDPHSMENIYKGTTAEMVADIFVEIGGTYTKHNLTLEQEQDNCLSENCPQLNEVIKNMKSNFAKYGNVKSAGAVLKVANAMRRSDQQQIYKALNNKNNKKLIGILLDIAGGVQTYSSHQAVLKTLMINTDKYDLDQCERYFWALSLYPSPSLYITKDIIEIIKNKHHDKKLYQTLLQTGAAMVYKIALQENNLKHELMGDIVSAMKEELTNCENDDDFCKQQYLEALGQTRSPYALPILIKYATTSTARIGMTAMKGIEKIGPSQWTGDVYKLAEQILLSESGFDSSSRIIALEILITQDLSDIMIKRMLHLLNNHQHKEVNQFIIEKLTLKAEKCPIFKERLSKLMKEECSWNTLAQGGLSTSFSRYFMNRGFLSTDQEVSNGILKRGLVHVNLVHNNSAHSLFTLGLFSTGLSSIMSSNEESDTEEASAGMQIQLLGVEFRPFIFFTGTGDLMGHVWSGTASTKTPAYQAAILVSKSEGIMPLGPAGVWSDLSLNVAASLELAGQIEISLWYKNANSAVFNSLGLVQLGGIRVRSDFVKSKVDLQLSVEPSLDLTSEIDFSSSVALCLKLYQPSTVIRYNTYKAERIPDSKHKLRKSRFTTISVPGKTYALNKKNNEMCNAIHK